MAKLKKQIKKKFFPVNIPLLKREIELYSTDIKKLNEKRITLDLASELKGKALEVKFLVNVTEENATATPTETRLHSTYMKKITRKGTDYSEGSFITKCKDQKIRIKFTMVTRKKVTKKVLKGLRKNAIDELENWAKEKEFEKLVEEIITNKIQKELVVKLKKIYPLSNFEIKGLKILKEEYEEQEQPLDKEPKAEEKKE